MDKGVDILVKMKEIQNRSLAMKKISKEIYDETVAKMKEFQDYNERNTSSQASLIEQKRLVSTLEVNSQLLDRQLVIWETILREKKECLDEQREFLVNDQNNIFSARSTYCDTVYDFLDQHHENYSCSSSFNMYDSTEWKNLNDQILSLESELKTLDDSIFEKESAHNELLSIEEAQKQKELRYQKLLEERKQTLKNLMLRVKSVKLEKRKYQLNNTIENLYHQNSSDNFTFIQSKNQDESVVSTYFTESERSNSKPKALDKLLNNLYAQKSQQTAHNASSIKESSSFPSEKFDGNADVKRCKISNHSAGTKGKFKPKQPLLAKKVTH